METILEQCELNDKQTDSYTKNDGEFNRNITLDDAIEDEVESSEKQVLNDDASINMNAKADHTDDIPNKSEIVADSDSDATVNNESKDLNISFDEDIILPSVRHDPELEQKQRDRIKRKEMKSRKELEEEEREKMQ